MSKLNLLLMSKEEILDMILIILLNIKVATQMMLTIAHLVRPQLESYYRAKSSWSEIDQRKRKRSWSHRRRERRSRVYEISMCNCLANRTWKRVCMCMCVVDCLCSFPPVKVGRLTATRQRQWYLRGQGANRQKQDKTKPSPSCLPLHPSPTFYRLSPVDLYWPLLLWWEVEKGIEKANYKGNNSKNLGPKYTTTVY